MPSCSPSSTEVIVPVLRLRLQSENRVVVRLLMLDIVFLVALTVLRTLNIDSGLTLSGAIVRTAIIPTARTIDIATSA